MKILRNSKGDSSFSTSELAMGCQRMVVIDDGWGVQDITGDGCAVHRVEHG